MAVMRHPGGGCRSNPRSPIATLVAIVVLPKVACSHNHTLASLTQDVETMMANRQILEEQYCPTNPSCDTNPGPAASIDPFTIAGWLFVIAVGVAVGTDTTVESLRVVVSHSKKPFVIGVFCQFMFMPVFACLLTVIFEDDLRKSARYNYESAVLGVMIVGSLPGGTTSNLFTWLVGGNVSLSILMSWVSNLAALGMMPLLLYVYFDVRFKGVESKPEIPYLWIVVPLLVSVWGICAGMLVRAKGSPELIWWVAKISSLVALIFLIGAVAGGVAKNPTLITEASYSTVVIMLLIQPVGYMIGWVLAHLWGLSLRNKMTIAFETGVQSFALGLVVAQISFNTEKEACQFSNECMDLIQGTDTEKYEFAWDKGGSIEEGDGKGKITTKGFLPGNAGARGTGGCCRYNELVFEDTFRFSALCGVCYPIHAFWMIIFFRKVFPRGRKRMGSCKQRPVSIKDDVFESVGRSNIVQADGELVPAMPKSGFASAETCPPMTVPELFYSSCKRCGPELALCVEPLDGGCPTENKMEATKCKPIKYWTRWTWTEYKRDVDLAANAFVYLGVERFGSVAIFGFNAPQWIISAMAAMSCGAKAVGIYPTDTTEQVVYKTKHSGAVVAVVEDEKKLQRYAGELANLPKLSAFIMYLARPEKSTFGESYLEVHAWQAFLELGRAPELREKVEASQVQLRPGNACLLIYTSGTTGMAKAVMLSHDNLVSNTQSFYHMYRFTFGVEYEPERVLSYLPLSHIAGFMSDISLPIFITGQTKGYCTTYFARPYDLKEGTLRNRLTFVRPTLFLGVPRVFEKMEESLRAVSKKTEALRGLRSMMPIICCIRKTSCIRWSKKQGLNSMRQLQVGGTGRTTAFYGLAEAAILSKVRVALGLDACKGIFSGAAPISRETLEYFGSLGININEVYGMSESTGGTTLSTDERHLWGTCGFEAPGVQTRVFQVDPGDINKKSECPAAQDIFNPSEKEQGEICFRGRHIMMGYMANPDLGPEHVEEITTKTNEAIDTEGWLHSGDKGCADENGMIRITGRYKELIITAGGENVAPIPIEDCIKKNCPAISNVMMVGDKRKYNVCIVTLKAEGATGELPGTEELAGPALQVVPGVTTTTAAKASPEYRKVIEDAIKAANKDSRVCPSNASQVQKFEILPLDFSVEGGELTATLKLKRKFTEGKHSGVLDSMYGSM